MTGLKVGSVVTGVPINSIISDATKSLSSEGDPERTKGLVTIGLRDVFKGMFSVATLRQMDRVAAEWTILAAKEYEVKGTKKAQEGEEAQEI